MESSRNYLFFNNNLIFFFFGSQKSENEIGKNKLKIFYFTGF